MTGLLFRRLITFWLVCQLATLPFALLSPVPEAVWFGSGIPWLLMGCALSWLRSDD